MKLRCSSHRVRTTLVVMCVALTYTVIHQAWLYKRENLGHITYSMEYIKSELTKSPHVPGVYTGVLSAPGHLDDVINREAAASSLKFRQLTRNLKVQQLITPTASYRKPLSTQTKQKQEAEKFKRKRAIEKDKKPSEKKRATRVMGLKTKGKIESPESFGDVRLRGQNKSATVGEWEIPSMKVNWGLVGKKQVNHEDNKQNQTGKNKTKGGWKREEAKNQQKDKKEKWKPMLHTDSIYTTNGSFSVHQNLTKHTSSLETTNNKTNKTRYLFYICDGKTHCYGLGDRQRAIVSTYYLAEVTNRRFGIIMTSPANIRDFYEPNMVKWDIKPHELPRNASTFEITALGPLVSLHLDKIDFNAVYPQDVVYVRTNQIFWNGILKNPIYHNRVPKWARVHVSQLIGIGWIRLMKPTPLLRRSLNEALVTIAQKILDEADTWNQLKTSRCCKKKSLPRYLPICAGNTTICPKSMASSACCDTLKQNFFSGCHELRAKCSAVDYSGCVREIGSNFPKRWGRERAEALAQNLCTAAPPVFKVNESLSSIRNKTGYEMTDMNLVCAHIRLGYSKTFPFERTKFNKPESVTEVWHFLQSFADKGYHLYLASDAQEVKDEAKAIFGERLHMAEDEIVHIGVIQKDQDATTGLQFTLTEQLLMATACKEMLKSHSGYSGRAVEMRNTLTSGRVNHVYFYEGGKVT